MSTTSSTPDTSKRTSKVPTVAGKLTRAAEWTIAVILLLMPFHAFLTVSLSEVVGHYNELRLWKEGLLTLLVVVGGYLAWRTPGLWQRVRSGWLLWSIAAYTVLQLLLGLVALHKHQVNSYAMAYAWVINLRFLAIFCVAFVLAARSRWLADHWKQFLLLPAVLVVAFGLLQRFLLPVDFLSHLGYGQGTIVPYETVDQKLAYVRIQSTLRGANPLGAYLVLPVTALVALLVRTKRDQKQIVGITFLSASLLVLAVTYSRSAYVGAFISAVAAVALVMHGRQSRRRLAYGLAALVVLGTIALLALRTNDRFENTFFHTDEHSQSQTSSNQQRVQAYDSALSQVVHEPFGRGPGTAGPASEHNRLPERIAENYYLQIGQEVGWLGMALFAAILLLTAKRLWQRRAEMLPRILLASLLGISFINLTSHAWTDDTLALVWWGLAGIACAPAILTTYTPNKNNTNHGKTTPNAG